MNELALLKGLSFVDSFFPSGGFAFSFGLEAAVQEGIIKDGESLSEYLVHLLRFGVGGSDAIAVGVAHQALIENQINEAISVDRKLDAMKSCREIREGSRQMGKQVIRLGSVHLNHSILNEMTLKLENQDTPCHHSVAFGMVLGACQWSKRETILGYLYQVVVGWVFASIRLLPIGHQEGQSLIHGLFPHVINVSNDVHVLGQHDMKSWIPLHEIRAMRHSRLRVRLFRS